MLLLKGLHMDLFIDELPLSEFQCWGNRSKVARDIPGGTELSAFRVGVGGTTFSHMEVLAEAILLSPHVIQHVDTQPPYLNIHQPG